MDFYGKLYRFCRRFVSIFWPTYQVIHPDRLADPSVYVCRHFNSRGSFQTLPWLTGKIHPWVMHFYCDRDLCFKHLMGFTLTKRFGWRLWKARIWASLVAGFLPRLMQSVRAIPVYRNSMHVLQTYRLSVKALLAGESLLLFADRDYTSETQIMGEMYDGFLALDRLYFRASGQHIRFVTLYADTAKKELRVGEPLMFRQDTPDRMENNRIYESIKAQLSGLSFPSPASELSGTDKTATDEPAISEPGNAQPANGEATNAQPANGEPANAQPANGEPANAQPAACEPANARPAAGKFTADA